MDELREWVYCSNESATVRVQANGVASYALWHSHLEHPSNQVISMLPKDLGVGSSYGTNKIDACDVCLCAK